MLEIVAVAAAIVAFQTPGGNIHCAHLAFRGQTELRCDVNHIDNEPKAKPAWCEFDYGTSFGLTPRGRGRRLCVSDTVAAPDSPVLAYGKTWRKGAFRCRSRRRHLRCTNRRGHGFTLSRSRQRVF